MKKILFIAISTLIMWSCTQVSSKKDVKSLEKKEWKSQVEQTLKFFGHRNWIVIADGAYPEQSNPAIKTITIDDSQLDAVAFVNEIIQSANHINSNIFIDKEMAFVPEKDANGIGSYRSNLDKVLKGQQIQTKLHEDIIRELDTSAKLFNVLIIKTDLAIPYTSVFFQLECGYWNANAEKNMRQQLESANSETQL